MFTTTLSETKKWKKLKVQQQEQNEIIKAYFAATERMVLTSNP